jgi:hypothetical protein
MPRVILYCQLNTDSFKRCQAKAKQGNLFFSINFYTAARSPEVNRFILPCRVKRIFPFKSLRNGRLGYYGWDLNRSLTFLIFVKTDLRQDLRLFYTRKK